MAVPELGPADALVEVAYCGVCGTDLHMVLDGWGTPDTIFGHEWAGRVTAAGTEARIEVGTPVVGRPWIECGRCDLCLAGRPALCAQRPLAGADDYHSGGFARYLATDWRNLTAVPDGLSLRHAAYAEPLAVAMHAITRAGAKPDGRRVGEHNQQTDTNPDGRDVGAHTQQTDEKPGGRDVGEHDHHTDTEPSGRDVGAHAQQTGEPPGGRAMVFGCGPIGAAVVAVLATHGVDVTVVEPQERRRSLARRLGARVRQPEELEAPGHPGQVPDDAVEWVFETSGARRAAQAGLAQLAHGGTMVLVGTGLDYPKLDTSRVILNELVITGAYEYDPDGLPAALRLIASGRLPMDMLVEPEPVGLDGLLDIMGRLRSGEVAGKAMVRP